MKAKNENQTIDELIKKIENLDINANDKKGILKLINNLKRFQFITNFANYIFYVSCYVKIVKHVNLFEFNDLIDKI